MVPIRIELEGFLSYRDRTVLTFDGAPLWMLSGPNGAGKSSVFDAITYALYGLHRGGSQHYDDLINHQSDQMVVQFDFSLGDALYRVKRTHAKRKSPTFYAARLVDGNPITIPDTQLQKGFNTWIQEVVGLKADAFTTSVLLQQNKSDALLTATATERHSILSQIVDLSAYNELHKKVKDEHATLNAHAKLLDSQLLGLERVDEAEVERLGNQARKAREESQKCVERLQQLAALKVHASTWQRNEQDRAALDAELSGVRALLARGDAVTRDHERWSELKIHLPDIERALALGAEARTAASKYLDARAQGQAWQRKHDDAEREHALAREQASLLADELRGWRARSEAAREVLDSTADAVREVGEAQRLESQASSLRARLSAFAPGFEGELGECRREHDELSEIALAVPALKAFGRARKSWVEMKDASSQAREDKAQAESDLALAHGDLPGLEQNLAQAEDAHEAARADETRVRALVKGERERAKKLASGDDAGPDATCDRCGGPLNATRLAEERARREEAVAELVGELAGAEESVDVARARREDARARHAQCKRQIEGAQAKLAEAEGTIGVLRKEGHTLGAEVERLVAGLPEAFGARFSDDVARASDHFKGEFPTAEEVRSLENRATKRPSLASRLQALEAQAKERESLHERLSECQAQLAPLLAAYPPEERARLESQSQSARATISMAKARADELAGTLREAEEKRDGALARSQSATRALADAVAAEKVAQALETSKNEQRDDLLGRLEGEWKVIAQNASAEDAARMRRELESLRGAPDELAALRRASEGLSGQLAREKELLQALEATPAEHRRLESEVRAEEEGVQAQKSRADDSATESESEKQNMEAQRDRRQQVAEDAKLASRAAYTHDSLAKQLGPNALQRHLLQQAEAVIVENANRVLDEMSSGNLQLQLKASDDAPSSGKPAASKALEMLAINQATGGRPMPVEFLSGSQKFRVAVALALGIGQFASGGGRGDGRDRHQGARRIESVIIDEGFGSLDQEGRQNIVNELRGLSSVLKRVIVVSHQEELARAFPSRYEITLQNGTSTARIIEAEG